MSIPPWIRSPSDTSVAAARLESQAAVQAHARSAGELGDEADPGSLNSETQGGAAVPDGPAHAPREREAGLRTEAAIATSLRRRPRAKDSRPAEPTETPEAELTERAEPAPEEPTPRGTTGPIATASALVGLVACIATGFALGGGFSTVSATDSAASTEVEAQSAELPIGEPAGTCAVQQNAGFLRSNGPGDRLSPVGIVAAFEYAYYVDKDSGRAAELTAPEAGIDPARLHDQGIARLPEGTTHCLEARETRGGIVTVELSELRPGAEPIVIHQQIHTSLDDDGIYVITKIEHTEGPA